jgi:hypothetical protein
MVKMKLLLHISAFVRVVQGVRAFLKGVSLLIYWRTPTPPPRPCLED